MTCRLCTRVVIVLGLYFATTFMICGVTSTVNIESKITSQNNSASYLVWSPQCKILALDPFHSDAMKVFKRQSEETCSKKRPLTSTFTDERTGKSVLLFDKTAKVDFGLGKSVNCYYQQILRPKSVDSFRLTKPTVFTNSSTELPSSMEFLYVGCKKNSKSKKVLYKNVHYLMTTKPVIEERFKKFPQTAESKRPISVLMVLIDNISRLNLIRTMPKTVKNLNKNKWFELRGYNKMHLNSFPNAMAILTGFNEQQAYKTCKPEKAGYLNKCPMLWYTYRDYGYATAYGEDETWISTFNYKKLGFTDPPTDYYMRPLMLAAEKHLDVKEKSGLTFCLGLKHSADYLWDYAIDFAQMYKEKPYFGLFWMNTFSHNGLNDPSSMDNSVDRYLEELQNKAILNDSVVIFFSDHGIRFGQIRRTFAGWQEERLPFMYISLPPWLQKERPEFVDALRLNRNRLTSPYDLHLTLKHILSLSGRVVPNEMPGALNCPQCQSLFKPVPFNRSCKEAGIDLNWCTCNDFHTLQSQSKLAQYAAVKVVSHLNHDIKRYLKGASHPDGSPLCAKYNLNEVSWAAKTDTINGTFLILIQLTMRPNAVAVESIVFDDGKVHQQIKSITIFNFNYRNSHCVNDSRLKGLCFCTKHKLK